MVCNVVFAFVLEDRMMIVEVVIDGRVGQYQSRLGKRPHGAVTHYVLYVGWIAEMMSGIRVIVFAFVFVHE